MKRIELIIERLPDWNYGAFLDETSASCIAIGQTEIEAWNNGMRRLIETYRFSKTNNVERDSGVAKKGAHE